MSLALNTTAHAGLRAELVERGAAGVLSARIGGAAARGAACGEELGVAVSPPHPLVLGGHAASHTPY
jgi:hypothetical protein